MGYPFGVKPPRDPKVLPVTPEQERQGITERYLVSRFDFIVEAPPEATVPTAETGDRPSGIIGLAAASELLGLSQIEVARLLQLNVIKRAREEQLRASAIPRLLRGQMLDKHSVLVYLARMGNPERAVDEGERREG